MIKLPVRQLVERILRCGDIDGRYVSKDRMLEGAIAHRILQKSNRKLYEEYQSEVQLTAAYHFDGLDYTLEGRADGIFFSDGRFTIDEIKTTLLPMHYIHDEFNQTHWAQAKCYAYIYALQNDLREISVQLTYFNIETKESKQLNTVFEREELEAFIKDLIEKYSVWAKFTAQWELTRNHSVRTLEFPFTAYRKGQRALAVSTYRTIERGNKLFAQAPTGTGKTISVLFPAIKAIGEGKTSKIFYLTAKTITRQVAEEAFEKMRLKGLRLKTLTLTAKDKICFCEKTICHPEYCEYAKGHYDRVNEAILDAVEECDDLSRPMIEKYARKHRVCPFEFSLDISLLADAIICDYNYVFDPQAYLRRFFSGNSNDYVFLIDEAHNLVDRSREMFSAQLAKTEFYKIKKEVKGKNKALDKSLNKINKFMIDLRKQCGEGYLITAEKPEDFLKLLVKYIEVCELILKEDKELREDNDFLQLYFQALGFMTIADFYDERYVTFVDSQREEVTLKLFCLDPSFLLREVLKRGRSAILFSATLSPLPYFRDILGGDEEDKLLSLDSPFEHQSLCVMTADQVSTKYHDREASLEKIARLIGTFVSRKKGNYIVYFPSYRYMKDVFQEFIRDYPQFTAVEQEVYMSEEDREGFLESFVENPEKTYVAFCVLGGIFSEGIDLKGSRLIGAAIVSVGLPQLNIQQNIIRDYFNTKNGMGYEYAYMYPGMNKVLQAAGRVIRCESDIGVVLLIDERYGHRNYLKLFPNHWKTYRQVKDHENLEKTLDSFWTIK